MSDPERLVRRLKRLVCLPGIQLYEVAQNNTPGIKTVCICAFVIKRKSDRLRKSVKPKHFVAVFFVLTLLVYRV